MLVLISSIAVVSTVHGDDGPHMIVVSDAGEVSSGGYGETSTTS